MPRKLKAAQQPVETVARKQLGELLSSVMRRLSKAVTTRDSVEAIHRLRVATRRARAALELYATVLPGKRVQWFQKQLRKLRKSADTARNLDVFANRLKAEETEIAGDVLQVIATHRHRSLRPLVKLERRLTDGKRWQKKQRELLAKIGHSASTASVARQSIRPFALQALLPRIHDFSSAISMKDRSVGQLHRLRVAGKKLRYTVELTQMSLPKPLSKSVLSHLQKLQAVLGDLNDLATASEVADELASVADGRTARKWFKQRRKQERVAFSEARAKFLRTWTPKERQKWHDWFERIAAKADKHGPSAAVNS